MQRKKYQDISMPPAANDASAEGFPVRMRRDLITNEILAIIPIFIYLALQYPFIDWKRSSPC
ncbi:hypothetical protein SCFA_1120002 [anaerobic digester metagenome]|jgi:hypothetical protein|uniref:Uncharacterized protein n=1 Tax=anaerobic digester metagenome TaxID=1263854 RepID=A0A485LUL1_9ZZZZ